MDAQAHALEVRCEPMVVEAIASPIGISLATARAVGQLFDDSDLSLQKAQVRALANVLSRGGERYQAGK
ncbi:hypothetical protein D3C86_2208880 [compost metagenome]